MAYSIPKSILLAKRIKYLEQEGTVAYRSKDGNGQKTFSALEWLAYVFAYHEPG
ncbi:MAG: hypothetical protein QMD11_03335 [Smithella sp.]|nr:hypothetical protein [Smithella sp.]